MSDQSEGERRGGLTPSEARARGRIAAHSRWAHEPDRTAATVKTNGPVVLTAEQIEELADVLADVDERLAREDAQAAVEAGQ